MPSIEFGCQQSNVTVPDVEMFPGFEVLDNKYFSYDDEDLFQSFSTKLGIPLIPEGEAMKEAIMNPLSLSTFQEFSFNIAQNNSEYLFEETNKIKNEIKSEPGSPDGRYLVSSASLVSTSQSESDDSDAQITSSMQDVSDSIKNFTLKASLLSPLQCVVSSPQSFQISSDTSDTMQQTNVTQKNILTNQQDVQHAKCSLAKLDNTKHVFMWPTDAKTGELYDTTLQNFATVMGYTTKLEQMLPSSTCQVLSENESINTPDSSVVDSIGTRTGTTAFQLPQNMKIINTVSNICPANATELVDTSSILNNDSVICNIVTSDPINSTSFQLMQNKTSSNSLILTDANDIVNLPRSDQECSLKALKRRQRMIKNRESACLSRKKRKEYVSSLERQVSELKEENKQLKSENEILKQRLIEIKDSITNKNNKFGNLSIEALKPKRRYVAIFLSLTFLVSFSGFNGTFQQYHLKIKPDNLSITMPEIVHTRRLLWTIDESNENMDNQINENFNKSIPIHPVCPMYINQSESIRLDSELRRWIDGESDRDNGTTSNGTNLQTSLNVMLSRLSLEEKPKRRLYLSRDRKIKTVPKLIGVHSGNEYSNDNAVDVFSPTLSKHASLFEALGRKDDTFYVVWFSGEHLLLPASRKNDTARPKMSLVLPAVSINGTFSTPSNHITMMQIECEVTNTQLLHLQQSIIPVHLRNGRSTSQSNQSHSIEDIIDPSAANLTRNYKPYFMKEATRKQRYRKDIA